jgi:hypothetical protein
MKYLLILAIILILSGCTEKKIVHVDPTTIKYPQMPELKIVCDKRGYAYYKQYVYTETYIYTPILRNYDSTYQLLCKDL